MPNHQPENTFRSNNGWIKNIVQVVRQLQRLAEELGKLVFAAVMLFALVVKATHWLIWLTSH
jgi:hypothetical protein